MRRGGERREVAGAAGEGRLGVFRARGRVGEQRLLQRLGLEEPAVRMARADDALAVHVEALEIGPRAVGPRGDVRGPVAFRRFPPPFDAEAARDAGARAFSRVGDGRFGAARIARFENDRCGQGVGPFGQMHSPCAPVAPPLRGPDGVARLRQRGERAAFRAVAGGGPDARRRDIQVACLQQACGEDEQKGDGCFHERVGLSGIWRDRTCPCRRILGSLRPSPRRRRSRRCPRRSVRTRRVRAPPAFRARPRGGSRRARPESA